MRVSRRLAASLRAGVHVGAFLPLLWLFVGAYTGRLAGDPVEAILHFLGKGTLHILLLSLCVAPLAKRFGIGPLLRLRRPLGLWAFAYASLHLAAWLSLDLQFGWALIAEEITKRNYLLVGFSAWLVLLALAVTSVPAIMRRMGARWKKLHNWVYVALLLGLLHYIWSVKSGLTEPAIYWAFGLALLALRYRKFISPWRRKRLERHS